MKLHAYASGNGSLSLVWLDGAATTDKKVEKTHAQELLDSKEEKHLKKEGWKVVELNGMLHFARKIIRINAFTLKVAGKKDGTSGTYRYSICPDKCFHGSCTDAVTDHSLTIEFPFIVNGNRAWHDLKNQNVRAAIRFFLNNEKELTEQWSDK